MKILTITLLFIALAACGSEKPPETAIPPDADLKADVVFKGAGSTRSIETSFYFSKQVAPGVKDAPDLELIRVQEAKFNDTPLNEGTNPAGRTTYTAENLPVKAENLITAKINGRQWEARVLPQTTLENKSVTAVMTAK